jgi:parallel beta-helix repeat protein
MSGTKTVLRGLLLAVALAAMLLPNLPSQPSGASSTVMEWTERERIRIDSDLAFTAENGVVSGSGTKSDPYIIEGWKIGPYPNVTAIDIQNTQAYFRVRDVYVFSSSIGLLMSHVDNGLVENSQFANNSIGIAVVESEDCKVTGCTIEGSYIAVSDRDSDLSLSDNTYINNEVDVYEPKKKKGPWELTSLGATVCLVSLIPLLAFVTLLLYYRFRGTPPKIVDSLTKEEPKS